jgi:hypothetical protein
MQKRYRHKDRPKGNPQTPTKYTGMVGWSYHPTKGYRKSTFTFTYASPMGKLFL